MLNFDKYWHNATYNDGQKNENFSFWHEAWHLKPHFKEVFSRLNQLR